jgi:hypothetical protein
MILESWVFDHSIGATPAPGLSATTRNDLGYLPHALVEASRMRYNMENSRCGVDTIWDRYTSENWETS